MLAFIHGRVAIAVVLYMLVLGFWGLVSFFRKAGISESYRGALFIGEALTVVQALLGVALLADGRRPPDALHYLYGILVPLIIPFMYSYVRAQPKVRAAIFYGIATLFIVGLAVRAIMTG